MMRPVRYSCSWSRDRAFTLVELLVVLGIIVVLLAVLLPAVNAANRQAKRVQCQSNLRQLGQSLLIYAQNWKGWIVPPGLDDAVAPMERWPAVVFRSAVVNPAVMRCPADYEPAGERSYMLNWHLIDREVRITDRRRMRLLSPARKCHRAAITTSTPPTTPTACPRSRAMHAAKE